MRYEPHTYEGAKKSLLCKILRLEISGLLISQSLVEVENYIAAADLVNGEPQPNMEWSPVNYRNGYQHDIPGLFSEVLAQCNAARICGGAEKIIITQDKETQHDKKIDFFAGEYGGVQSKTLRFNGTRTSFERTWLNGEARFLALTDIDDKVCFWIKKEMVASWIDKQGLYIHKWDLEKYSDLWWDNSKHY
jgi:hypothetical protein